MICRRCNRECDGTLMRTDKRYSRVRTMLESEAPRDAEGRFLLCHLCQRAAYFSGSVSELLIKDIRLLSRKGSAECCPRCGSGRVGSLNTNPPSPGRMKCYACRRQYTTRSFSAQRASKVPEAVWKAAEHLFAAGKSTAAVAAELGVTQKTAWLLKVRQEAAQ